MAENSTIEWTDHTFNPWIGCTKVSPGCLHCYAETQDNFRKWTPDGWGKGKPRRRTSTALWNQVRKWNRDAERRRVSALHSWPAGKPLEWSRPRVFCASLADWLDDEVPVEWLADLLQLIHETPALDWLLLTKRPENFTGRTCAASFHLSGYRDGQTSENPTAAPMSAWEAVMDWSRGICPLPNVWVGTTVEDQTRADQRIPKLLEIPARVRFLSCEPLLGPVDLFAACFNDDDPEEEKIQFGRNHRGLRFGVDWVIAGGESGPGARPMHPEWARSLRDQCQAAGVPFLFKQWGEWSPRFDKADREAFALANDGALYPMPDIAPDGARRAEALRAGHDKAALCCVYRVGKKAAGRVLDGRTWDEFPTAEVRA
jgi:protein gp37